MRRRADHRRLARGVAQVIGLLALGVVTALLVALAAGRWGRVRIHDIALAGRTTADESGWNVTVYRRPGIHYVEAWRLDQRLRLRDQIGQPHATVLDDDDLIPLPAELREPAGDHTYAVIVHNARGWPLPALVCSVRALAFDDGDARIDGGAPVDAQAPPDCTNPDARLASLPWRPHWPGLLIDGALFAAAWGGLAFVGATVRRRQPILRPGFAAGLTGSALLAGMAITIAVAAGMALCCDELYFEGGPGDGIGRSVIGAEDDPRIWEIVRDEERGAVRVRSVWHVPASTRLETDGQNPTAETLLPAWARWLQPQDGSETSGRIADARGWPWPALWGGFELRRPVVGGRIVEQPGPAHRAIVLPRYDGETFRADWTRIVPLAPLWPGFLLSSAFYAAGLLALYGLLVDPRLIQRTRRSRRGACLRCGYDLHGAGSSRCPECGLRDRKPDLRFQI